MSGPGDDSDGCISGGRKEYGCSDLAESSADPDPMVQFSRWFAEAEKNAPIEPNAMALATATADGRPSLRMVLLKEFNAEGFIFYTNYLSRKGMEINANPRAALLFYWAELERQVRIEGAVRPIPADRSDTYFQGRPRGAKISAIVSAQSHKIADRSTLETQAAKLTAQFADDSQIKRPAHWGGYILEPVCYEFWQGRENRLHDRILYELKSVVGEGGSQDRWHISRLAP